MDKPKCWSCKHGLCTFEHAYTHVPKEPGNTWEKDENEQDFEHIEVDKYFSVCFRWPNAPQEMIDVKECNQYEAIGKPIKEAKK